MDNSQNNDQRQEQAPEMRIPTPQIPLWSRCWQTIGSTVMDTAVLKEPRGFMRCLEWLFAVIAFATCANFSTTSVYSIKCQTQTTTVTHPIAYPFKLDETAPILDNKPDECFKPEEVQQFPGDAKSDAEFFVFTGVIAWLGATACLVIYIFFSQKYLDENKKGPMIDFCFTVIVAVFWLSASAAWANGVISLKTAADSNDWLTTTETNACWQKSPGQFNNTKIVSCTSTSAGSWGGANASIMLGFLNFFLWTSNLWFIYKETAWFANRAQSGIPAQQMG